MAIERRVGRVVPLPEGSPGTFRLQVEAGEVRVGDDLHIHGHGWDLHARLRRMEIDGQSVSTAKVGKVVDIFLPNAALEGADVFLVPDPYTSETGQLLRHFDQLERIPPAPGLAPLEGEEHLEA